jgi:hypothetical protein
MKSHLKQRGKQHQKQTHQLKYGKYLQDIAKNQTGEFFGFIEFRVNHCGMNASGGNGMKNLRSHQSTKNQQTAKIYAQPQGKQYLRETKSGQVKISNSQRIVA